MKSTDENYTKKKFFKVKVDEKYTKKINTNEKYANDK